MRAARWLMLWSVVALVAAGCGGGSEDEPAAGTTTSTPSSTTSTTPGDEAIASRSQAVALTLEDMGDAWSEHTAAQGHVAPSEDSCLSVAGAIEDLPDGGRYVGPILQYVGSTTFVRSAGYALADEDAAKRLIELAAQDRYPRCRAENLSEIAAADPGNPEGGTWRVSDVQESSEAVAASGVMLTMDYQFQATVDGATQDANGWSREFFLRKGPTVLLVIFESVGAADDPPDLDSRVTADLESASQRAFDRLDEG